MENKQNVFLEQKDFIDFTLKLIHLKNKISQIDYLNSISLYYDKNKSLFIQIIEKINSYKMYLTFYNTYLSSSKTSVSLENIPSPSSSFEQINEGMLLSIRMMGNYNKNPNEQNELNELINTIQEFENKMKEDKIEKHYLFLSRFLSFTNNNINEVFEHISGEDSLYKNVKDEIVRYGTIYLQKFQRELSKKLEGQEDWMVIEVDMKNKFLPIINGYCKWFEINKEETKKFEPVNFYAWMYEIMRSTEKEINKWFKVEQPAAPKPQNIKAVEEVKTFIDYFNPSTPQREKLAESLKNEFKVEKGKAINLLIKLLEKKSILNLGEREKKNFLESMIVFFGREIGTYQSINDFKYNENTHKKDLDSINIRLEKIINEYEKQENSL